MTNFLERRIFASFLLRKVDRSMLLLVACYSAFWAIVSYLMLGSNYRILLMLCVATAILIGWSLRPVFGMAAIFAYLLLLGDIRRMIDMVMGQRAGLDPLLLIGGLAASLFALPVLMRLRVQSVMAKVVLALTAVMILGIFNPSQGPLLVGITGAMFYVVPLLWFWIGRAYITEESLTALFSFVILPLGLAAAILGIGQTLFGFLPWEKAWIDSVAASYSSLYVGPHQIRSFGYSINSAEYGSLLVLVIVFVISQVLTKHRVLVLLLPILGVALVFASGRGNILRCVLAAIAMWAVATRRSAAIAQRLTLLAVCCVIGFAVLSKFNDNSDAPPPVVGTTATSATNHVTNGFAHPLDPRYSTAGVHLELIGDGFLEGFKHPIGLGIGITTPAGAKFGTQLLGTEVDITDLFISIGAIGGLLYMYFIAYTMARTYELVRADFSGFNLTIWGIEISMLGQWMANGQHSIGPIIWICLGYACKTLEAKKQNDPVRVVLRSPHELPSFPVSPQGI